jgi:hypothetical protein
MFGEEVESYGGLDPVTLNPLWPCPVIVADGFEASDAASCGAALEASTTPILLFDIDDVLDDLARAESPLLRERDEVVEMFGGMSQPERVEPLSEGSHDLSFRGEASPS